MTKYYFEDKTTPELRYEVVGYELESNSVALKSFPDKIPFYVSLDSNPEKLLNCIILDDADKQLSAEKLRSILRSSPEGD